ncbi:hypothetical protein [Levilactobacillus suantsaii]|uniref:Uncharacterized protein n=1 Tax=Levilactobacillus suantsaii TaxID=2292255 RepID=A0A4Q0VI31_9LACO|nr:hypothetical protein [Levilactobacillus suantsaii]QMU08456.1 hypothetical protein H3M12_01915 [Levilactobacillus suantsaii]RXI77564.1 hypothetical protein DXH47_09030 [Levilactobacillus suantsaii]
MANPQPTSECFALPQKSGALLLIPNSQRLLYTNLLAYQATVDDTTDQFDDPQIDEAARSRWLHELDDQAAAAGESLDATAVKNYLFLLT